MLLNVKQGQPYIPPVQDLAGDGAVLIQAGVVYLNKASASAITLALPTAADKGKELVIVSTTAQAHVVTTPSNGYNNGTHLATYGAAIGNAITLRAALIGTTPTWLVVGNVGVTLS